MLVKIFKHKNRGNIQNKINRIYVCIKKYVPGRFSHSSILQTLEFKFLQQRTLFSLFRYNPSHVVEYTHILIYVKNLIK